MPLTHALLLVFHRAMKRTDLIHEEKQNKSRPSMAQRSVTPFQEVKQQGATESIKLGISQPAWSSIFADEKTPINH